MTATGNIQYLTGSLIDRQKWDQCILKSDNGLIYSMSFYLDTMSRQWSGLVMNDYEAVMPLCWNQKFGIHYLYQPPFVAMGGITGNDLDPAITSWFIDAIPKQFKFIDISFNPGNTINELIQGYQLKKNYILDLRNKYDELFDNYRENIRRNIKRSKQAGCYCRTEIPVEDVIKLHQERMMSRTEMIREDYVRFSKLYSDLRSKGQAITYGIYSPSHQLLASAVYFFSGKRAYYILVGNHPDGKTLGASHFLIDRFIADYCQKDLRLDFEGSDIPNLAFFYSSFGAVPETFPAVRINRLPWWVRWLKN